MGLGVNKPSNDFLRSNKVVCRLTYRGMRRLRGWVVLVKISTP